MNILLWVLQALLAFLYLSGGAYKVFGFDELARQYTLISRGGWGALGVIEMLGAILLVLPAAWTRQPLLTPIAAGVLALETLAIAAVYAKYSLALSASNPLIWSLVMGLLVAVVAAGRYALRPRA